jgi:uncharacterized Zn finger protein
MSPEDDNRFFRSGPKRPPPDHGIKLKAAGQTWWGQRWIEALERMAPDYALRLARGKTYARAGRTHDLSIHAGVVTAKVTGSRSEPYAIELRVTQLTAAAWQAAIGNMAEKAQFTAELLADQMPRAIDQAFASAGASLFPVRASDLATKCSCPDWANPCKHVAATHYVLGEALDRDPFLLFELRGRTKAQVLQSLRAARSGRAVESQATDLPLRPPPTPATALTLDRLSAADYDVPRAPLPSLQLDFEAPVAHAALLQQLGKPAAWSGNDSPADLLAPLVRAAADRARSIALGEAAADLEPEPLGENVSRSQPATARTPSAARTRSKERTRTKTSHARTPARTPAKPRRKRSP